MDDSIDDTGTTEHRTVLRVAAADLLLGDMRPSTYICARVNPPKTMSKRELACLLLVDGIHGVTTPAVFAQMVAGAHTAATWGLEQADIDTLLQGPNHPAYWDTWDDVVSRAALPYTDDVPAGVDPKDVDSWRWRLVEEEGDLWLVCSELEEHTGGDHG